MDKGESLANPYASVNIPRAQLKSSFVRNTIGEDLDGVVIANPSAVPTYTAQDRFSNNPPHSTTWEGNKIRTQESWRRPYNPYAPDKTQNGGHSDTMYTIDLDKRYKDVQTDDQPCCCYPYCKCCLCCQKSCCVIS